jgi:hypothetical protein
MLAQMRRPVIEASPQPLLSTTISTSKPSCCCPTSAQSTTSKRSAHYRSHLPPQPNPHSGARGTLRTSPPRVRSLAAFERRPPVDVARLSLAGIRNPAQEETPAPQHSTSCQRDVPKFRSLHWAAMVLSAARLAGVRLPSITKRNRWIAGTERQRVYSIHIIGSGLAPGVGG